MKLQNALL
jgi:serine/threonine protein kinase